MNTIIFMDIAITIFGIYLAFVAFNMKKTGKLSNLVVNENEMKKCKDTRGYIDGIVPYMYFFSIVSFVVGVIGVLCDADILTFGRIWSYLELGTFLIALAVFVQGMRSAKSKYF